MQKSKEATARIVVWRELQITNSYTLEASFCGSDFGKYSDLHFNTVMLQEIGHRFCETIIDYCMMDSSVMKLVLDDIESIVNNEASGDNTGNNPTGDKDANDQEKLENNGLYGIVNDGFGGGALGTIKDEDSNADSDFSGDDNSPKGGD